MTGVISSLRRLASPPHGDPPSPARKGGSMGGEAFGGVEVATADRGSGGSGRAVRGINDVTQRRISSPLSFIRKEKEGAVQRGTKERGTR